jgi:hypothetical protein
MLRTVCSFVADDLCQNRKSSNAVGIVTRLCVRRPGQSGLNSQQRWTVLSLSFCPNRLWNSYCFVPNGYRGLSSM